MEELLPKATSNKKGLLPGGYIIKHKHESAIKFLQIPVFYYGSLIISLERSGYCAVIYLSVQNHPNSNGVNRCDAMIQGNRSGITAIKAIYKSGLIYVELELNPSIGIREFSLFSPSGCLWESPAYEISESHLVGSEEVEATII